MPTANVYAMPYEGSRINTLGEKKVQFSALQRVPLPVQVAEKIRERIDQGDILPGAKLPSERELSESFSVSRVAVREAIQLLQAQFYVEVVQGKGTFVLDAGVRQASSLEKWIGTRGETLRMMVGLRKIVETGIAELAAQQASRPAAERLIDVAAQLETCPRKDLSEVDATFHREIATLTGNPLIEELLETCLARTEPLRMRTLRNTAGRKLAANGHKAIAKAIADGDPAGARAAMEAHMNDALNSL